jgi:hypothetical protein
MLGRPASPFLSTSVDNAIQASAPTPTALSAEPFLAADANAPSLDLRSETLQPSDPQVPIWLALLLGSPALLPMLFAFWNAKARGLVATGFIQYDLPYYLANGRQFFLNGFHLTYGNPYAPYETPAIYFQPHILLLGWLSRLAESIGLRPDAAMVVFHLLTLSFASIVAVRVYQAWIGWKTPAHKIGLICFFWGGGVLALGGLILGWFSHTPWTRSIFFFDAGDGWWLFNFGRNLVYPHEALYHGLFLHSLLLVTRKQIGWALAAAALLASCHPFTGLSLTFTLLGYAMLELIWRDAADPASPARRKPYVTLLIGSITILALHLGYYMGFLSRFEDHRVLEQQWHLPWTYDFWSMVPALYLVGVLSLGRMTRWKPLRAALADPRMRLYLVWFLVIFGLSHHDWLVQPRQPIHFAHGYDWAALFFLAAPGLMPILTRITSITATPKRVAAIAALLFIFLFDNAAFFTWNFVAGANQYAIQLTPGEWDTITWLRDHPQPGAYIATKDRWIGYLAPTYTSMRAWFGHDFNTPHATERKQQVEALFDHGTPLPTQDPVFFIAQKQTAANATNPTATWAAPTGAQLVHSNTEFEVWRSPASR